MSLETALSVASRIWCDQDYETVIMNPDLAKKIALLLKEEADSQGK